MSRTRTLATLAALILGATVGISVPVEAQQRVSNTATLAFDGAQGRVSIDSNTVTFDVAASKTPTALDFRLLPVGHTLQGMHCETLPELRLTPAPIDATVLAQAPKAARLDVHVPMILTLQNPGGNHDPTVRETSWINVRSQFNSGRLPLLETGPDTGIFAGGVTEGGNPDLGACDPTLDPGVELTLSFDEDDYSYASVASILIDPAGYVFDSDTGAPVDGTTVSLVDESGRPAQVFGDDGISTYPSTVVTGASASDASGRLYRFPPGYYRFPLTAPGRYRLKVEPPPTYRAPSTADRRILETRRDTRGKPFNLNDASFGGIFVLDKPDPFFSDIPVDRIGETQLLATKTASVREASPGDFVQYSVRLENRSDMPIGLVHLTDILPPGLRYERGSTRNAVEPSVSRDGRSLDFTIDQLGARATVEIRYVVSVAPGAPQGEAINRVLASGGRGATSNEAAAAVRLRAALFTDGFTIVGRVTEGDCRDPPDGRRGMAGVRLMMEDGTFVVTDRDGLYHFEGMRPGRHVVQLDTASITATHRPVACDADTRQAGSAISRFVDSEGGLLKRIDFQLRPTGQSGVGPVAALPAAGPAAEAAGNRDWFAEASPGVAMLFPAVGHNPRAPVLRVVVQHRPGQRVALRIDDAPVDAMAFDTTDTRGQIAISKWTGIPLHVGANRLEARVLNRDGSVADTIRRTVHSAGPAANAIFAPGASRLLADGLTRPLLAFRLTDRDGYPVRDGTTVNLRIGQPYAAASDTGEARAGTRDRTRGVARVIGDDGLAYVALDPTTQAGAVQATVALTDRETQRSVDIRAWMTGAARDWTIVGFAAGTLGHDVLRKHTTALSQGKRGRVTTDGQLAFYAKGRIKGAWLLTIAYDTDRKYDRTRGALGTIDPDRYYTVYGDATQQGYDAPTQRKLYLRLERREFYALFGDFETGLTQTQLARYSRTLNGAKIEHNGNVVSFAGFAARTDAVYARDEIRGNGLSGPYRLSGRDIIPNSDKLRLETRDRLRPERIVASTPLTRHIDYDIDTTIGTIRFREPVLGRDASNNPVFIVVDYETYGRGRRTAVGGRIAARLGDRIAVGASMLRDETAGNAMVVGLDVRARPTKTTEVRAEAATGGRRGITDGKAWLVEAEHHGSAVDLVAYARTQAEGFGLGQQNIVEAGTRKMGFDGRVRLSERVSLTGSAWHQDQLAGPGERTAGDARIELRRSAGTIFAGGQIAIDRGIDGERRHSKLLTLGGTQALLGGRLTLNGQTQFAPGGEQASVDFPARHQLLASYRLTPGIRVIGGYEIAKGRDFTTDTARVGFDVAPWTGAKLTSTINQQAAGENGTRTFAQYGLVQSLPIGPNWTIDATLDASTTVRGAIPTGGLVHPFQSDSGGGLSGLYGNDGDYVAVTLGAGYRTQGWTWNGRVEHRVSDQSKRMGITANLVRALGDGQTLGSGFRYYTVRQTNGATARSVAADVALALRPLDSRWSLLERLEMRNERADTTIGSGNILGVPAGTGLAQARLRAVNNLALNYRSGPEGAGHTVEATAYYGAKWVRGSYGADDYTGFIHIAGFDLRRDIDRRADVGVQGSVQHAWQRKVFAFSIGPSAGISPARGVWITAGYNVAGYRDRDFEEDRYSRAGPYVTMRMKFDQQSVARLAGARL